MSYIPKRLGRATGLQVHIDIVQDRKTNKKKKYKSTPIFNISIKIRRMI